MVSMDSIRTSGCNHHSADDCPLRFPFVFAATTAAGAAVVVDVFLLFFFSIYYLSSSNKLETTLLASSYTSPSTSPLPNLPSTAAAESRKLGFDKNY